MRYPSPRRPFRTQSGFGMLETLTGLVVFVVLAMAGTKAFHGVIANQRETAQVKALTDAVTVTAERLSAMSVSALSVPGSTYLAWSAPSEIGSGEYRFRYHVVPKPTISGGIDTTVVGLEVQVGTEVQGTFTPGRDFATLISPHLSSKDGLGQVSTALERAAEANFYAGLQARQKEVASAAVPDNQVRLNSFNCYDKSQCCGFMKHFFADPSMRPDDGLDQKCLYRCAMAGAVPVKEWNGASGTDFCAVAPWKSKEQCCAAISAGECQPGSVCAQVCIDCVGEDGSTCGPPICDGGWFNDFIDCANGKMCDGSPIPDAAVPGWGNIKTLCRQDACAVIQSECQARLPTCCRDYWGILAEGGTPLPTAEICATISKQSECCDMPLEVWDWDHIYCGTDGKAISAHNKVDGKWYCGMGGDGWNHACAYAKGCPSTYRPAGASGGGCAAFPGEPLTTPWQATYPSPEPPTVITTVTTGTGVSGGGGGPKTTTTTTAPVRAPSTRGGSTWGSKGGRE